MTLLVSWIGVDSRGPCSAYMAADSRIRWNSTSCFDYARKVFALRNSPDILGYCGDVLFPTMTLSQVSEMADRGLLFPAESSCQERFERIKKTLLDQFQRYPREDAVGCDQFEVIHISRDVTDLSMFECRSINWSRKGGWSEREIPIPSQSGILHALGSGANEFHSNLNRYNRGLNHGTSRNVFHCFCDTLFAVKDTGCGGAPQLVGIYRKDAAVTFGIIKDDSRYFLGTQIGDKAGFDRIEWRNDLFEICDGKTMKRKPEAQPQPDTLRRKSQ